MVADESHKGEVMVGQGKERKWMGHLVSWLDGIDEKQVLGLTMMYRRLGFALFLLVKIVSLFLSVKTCEPLPEHGVPANEEVGKEQNF